MSETPMRRWLQFSATGEADVFRMKFDDRHIGNPFIRALHGGVVGSMVEMSAEMLVRSQMEADQRVELVSSAIDYIRVTRDVDLCARATMVRRGRRLVFVEVWCWQDSEDLPVARGNCTLRIF
ncbi:MAG: PaaI family thioesterase [Nitratireductor sp.]|nr:PaaI family thioesterase [Nitratireductor sp.]